MYADTHASAHRKYTHTSTSMHTHTHKYVRGHKHAHSHKYTCTHAHSQTFTHTHTFKGHTPVFFLLGQSTQSATVVDWLEAVYLLMEHQARATARQLNNMHNVSFVVVDAMAMIPKGIEQCR